MGRSTQTFTRRVLVVVVDEQSHSVWHHVDYRLEALDAPLRRSRGVEHQRTTNGPGHPSGETTQGVGQAHCLGKAWRLPVNNRPSALGGTVPRTKTGSPGGDHQAMKPLGQSQQGRGHLLSAIPDHRPLDHLPTFGDHALN